MSTATLFEKLTVCIPTYNRARFLEYQLGWFLERIDRIAGITILVSDNRSTDDTADVVRRFADKLPLRYRVNQGPATGERNLLNANRAAETEYCAYLADDDFFHLDHLETVLRLLDQQPEAAAIFSPHWYYDAVADRAQGKFFELDQIYTLPKGQIVTALNFIIDRNIFPECAVYRRSALDVLDSGHRHAFWPFVQFCRLLRQGNIILQSAHSHYLFCTRHPVAVVRVNAGSIEAMEHWDRARGGLEYAIGVARQMAQLSHADESILQAKLEKFISGRMRVAVRLHLNSGNFLDAYMIASRLLGRGENFAAGELEALRWAAAFDALLQSSDWTSARLEASLPESALQILQRNSRLVSNDPADPLVSHAQLSEQFNRL